MQLLIHASYWVNTLGPSDAIWRWRSRLTLVQAMACCLTAPSHYLNQCWLMITDVQWQSPEGNFATDTSPSINNFSYKITFYKFYSNFPGANELIGVCSRGPICSRRSHSCVDKWADVTHLYTTWCRRPNTLVIRIIRKKSRDNVYDKCKMLSVRFIE